MSTELLSLRNKLLNGLLPVLDSTLERFESLKAKPTTTNSHLAEIVRSDIGYTLALFREVNSKLPATRDPVQTLEHAISMTGVPKAFSIGEQLTKISGLPEKVQAEIKSLYSQSIHASQYFTALGIQKCLPQTEQAAKDIGMMNMAQVLLWTNSPKDIESHVFAKADSSAVFPVSYLDDSMRELGLALSQSWKLPLDLQQGLAPFDPENPTAMTMIFAMAIAKQSTEDWHNEPLMLLIDYWAEATETPRAQISSTLHKLAAETGRQIDGRDLPAAAFSLLFPAPPRAENVLPDEKQETVEIKAESSKTSRPPEEALAKEGEPGKVPAQPEEKQEPVKIKPAINESFGSSAHTIEKSETPAQVKVKNVAIKTRDETKITKPLQDNNTAAKKPSSPFQITITRQLKFMQNEAGVSRAMFAMLSTDRKKLTVHFVAGGEKTDALRHFHADLTKKSIFSLLMSKPQSLYLTKENYKKYLQLIPSLEKKSLQINNLFAMSVFVNEKAIGLFLADNKKQLLTTDHYQKFKQSCNQAINDLANTTTRKEP